MSRCGIYVNRGIAARRVANWLRALEKNFKRISMGKVHSQSECDQLFLSETQGTRRPGHRILDVGSGTKLPFYKKNLDPDGIRYYALDNNSNANDLRKYPLHMLADARFMPLQDRSFDQLWALVFKITGYESEIIRLLKPGGLLVHMKGGSMNTFNLGLAQKIYNLSDWFIPVRLMVMDFIFSYPDQGEIRTAEGYFIYKKRKSPLRYRLRPEGFDSDDTARRFQSFKDVVEKVKRKMLYETFECLNLTLMENSFDPRLTKLLQEAMKRG